MRLDAAFALRDGIQYLGHPMADIVFDDVFHIEPGNENTNHGINQVEVIGMRFAEIVRQQILYQMYNIFEKTCSQSRKNTNRKTDNSYEFPFTDVLVTPF